ncbi:DUF397 domain-containing protein [Actinomadura alba]|uniref:DUF397 domain-containing protein n=1 Tax=Actinomadura alba TaxID=406431 RepID=A0ABR7LVH5_9ACTN|nr:DUF397 domain-containing protein [Actinomadura alba]MBC6468847.1 DUF397 domain-containing protein [Actinomadura alba]
MTELDVLFATWRKSSRSGSGTASDCVEVASGWRKSKRSHEGTTADCVELAVGTDRVVAMRDSKDPDGAVLCFTRPEWVAFLSRMKAGALDRTVDQA